jgi:hypothetical protein
MVLSVKGEAMSEITQSNAQPSIDQRVKQAIQMLWSSDNAIRELGRNEIMRIGPATIQPLTELLWDLIKNKSPRFAAGKEQEGHKVLNDYVELLRKTVRTGQFVGDSRESESLSRLAINSRLISDAIYLLGELKAVEAVPVLIYIMENTVNRTPNVIGLEMEALSNIGAPAVPFLIKSIENANISATRYEPVLFGYEIELHLEDSVDGESAKPQDSLALDDEDFAALTDRTASRIKGKAINVLGEIGDNNALSYLQNLARTVDDQSLVRDILEAIRRIKNEPSTSTGPQYPQQIRKPKHEF